MLRVPGEPLHLTAGAKARSAADRVADQDVIELAALEENAETGIGAALRKSSGQYMHAADEDVTVSQVGVALVQHLVHASQRFQPIQGLGGEAVTADLVAREMSAVQEQRGDPLPAQPRRQAAMMTSKTSSKRPPR